MAKDVCNDAAIKYELMSIYGSKASDEAKRKSLAEAYSIRPLDNSGGGETDAARIVCKPFAASSCA